MKGFRYNVESSGGEITWNGVDVTPVFKVQCPDFIGPRWEQNGRCRANSKRGQDESCDESAKRDYATLAPGHNNAQLAEARRNLGLGSGNSQTKEMLTQPDVRQERSICPRVCSHSNLNRKSRIGCNIGSIHPSKRTR